MGIKGMDYLNIGEETNSSVFSVLDFSINITETLVQNVSGNEGGVVVRGQNITINATIVDSFDTVQSVWVKIWEGAIGTSAVLFNGLMTFITGDLWSLEVVTNASFSVGTLNYTIYANNTIGSQTEINGTFNTTNDLPSVSVVNLNTTDVTTNDTNQDILANISVSDLNGDSVVFVYNWYTNGTLNMTTFIEEQALAYWPLDNNTRDYWSSYDGINNGSVQNTSELKVGYSYTFDGDEDFIEVGDFDNFSFVNATSDLPFTISAWVYINNVIESALLSKWDESTNSEEWAFGLDANNRLSLYLMTASNNSLIYKRMTVSPSANTWYHVAVTYNGNKSADGISIYLNGVETNAVENASIGAYLGMENTSSSVKIGEYVDSSGGTYNFNGTIDEMMIYNRTLNESEIYMLYQGSKYGGNVIDSSYTSKGDYWNLGVRAGDFSGFNEEVNSSNIMIFTESVAYNLSNISSGTTWIYWQWINPMYNFSSSRVYVDGVNVANTTDYHYVAENLTPSSVHNISVFTVYANGSVDSVGIYNISQTVDELCYGTVCLRNFSLPIGMSYPTVSYAFLYGSIEAMNDIGTNLTRIGIDWAAVEDTDDNFDWDFYDNIINNFTINNISVLGTFGPNASAWACSDNSSYRNDHSCLWKNVSEYREFLDEFFTRYSGNFSVVQFANEWTLSDNYVGDKYNYTESLNELYNSVKNNSPTTEVSVGGIVRENMGYMLWCEDGSTEPYFGVTTQAARDVICNSQEYNRRKSLFFYVLDNASYDLVDIHYYDDPEYWGDYNAKLDELVSVPIIVSEFGGPDEDLEPYSESYQFNKTKHYIDALQSMNIRDALFFKLVETSTVNHPKAGVLTQYPELREKPVYYLLKEYNDNYPASCGDGIVNVVESCDGTNLNGLTCSDFGYDTGSLSCDSSCDIDSSGCSNTGGGNGGGGGETCTDECSSGSSETNCLDSDTTQTRTCGDYDDDDCLEWSSWSSTDCGVNQECENGVCVELPECTSDDDCGDGEACINETCVVVDECFVDSDCDDSLSCSVDTCENGVCVYDNSTCECFVDSDCDDSLSCSVDTCVNNVCQYDLAFCSCSADSDCNDGNICTDDTCPSGNCVFSFNTNSCDDDDACTVNDKCTLGFCVGIEKVCGEGESCEDGECVKGESPQEIPQDITDLDGEDCNSDFGCGSWGKCLGDYVIEDIIQGKNIKGVQTRLCKDFNKCKSNFIEKRSCKFRVPVIVETKTWCGEEYLEIKNSSNYLLARMSVGQNERSYVNLTLNLLGGKYCPYCYDGVMNYDEEGVDCGGSCLDCLARDELSKAEIRIPILRYWGMMFLFAFIFGFVLLYTIKNIIVLHKSGELSSLIRRYRMWKKQGLDVSVLEHHIKKLQ